MVDVTSSSIAHLHIENSNVIGNTQSIGIRVDRDRTEYGIIGIEFSCSILLAQASRAVARAWVVVSAFGGKWGRFGYTNGSRLVIMMSRKVPNDDLSLVLLSGVCFQTLSRLSPQAPSVLAVATISTQRDSDSSTFTVVDYVLSNFILVHSFFQSICSKKPSAKYLSRRRSVARGSIRDRISADLAGRAQPSGVCHSTSYCYVREMTTDG